MAINLPVRHLIKGNDIIIRPDKSIVLQSKSSANQRYKTKETSINSRYHVIYHQLGHLAQRRLASFSSPKTRLSPNERDYIEKNLSIYPGENLVKDINGNYILKSYILYIQEVFAELAARVASVGQLDTTLQNIYDRILNHLP